MAQGEVDVGRLLYETLEEYRCGLVHSIGRDCLTHVGSECLEDLVAWIQRKTDSTSS